MRVLLDTCTFLWMVARDEALSAQARTLVLDEESDLVLSAASSWEIAIKVRIGKLALAKPPALFVAEHMAANDIESLPIEHAHALATADLPAHHGDPFDRLLAAQARMERLPLLSPDLAFDAYSVERWW